MYIIGEVLDLALHIISAYSINRGLQNLLDMEYLYLDVIIHEQK